jgi:hypothetical protein
VQPRCGWAAGCPASSMVRESMSYDQPWKARQLGPPQSGAPIWTCSSSNACTHPCWRPRRTTPSDLRPRIVSSTKQSGRQATTPLVDLRDSNFVEFQNLLRTATAYLHATGAPLDKSVLCEAAPGPHARESGCLGALEQRRKCATTAALVALTTLQMAGHVVGRWQLTTMGYFAIRTSSACTAPAPTWQAADA